MKAQETEAYDSQSSDEEVGDRDLRGKGLCLKKLTPIELVYFEFNVSLFDDNIFFEVSNSTNELLN
jgi:hypothetical protein